MECIAIIPARGGSKGIPRKNARPLTGRPLVAHTIEQARRSAYINRVVVSTDDVEIAAIAQQYGAELVWRPAEISGDAASSEAALLHALEHLQQREAYTPDILVFLQCTSPLTSLEDIDGAIQTLLNEEADSVFTAAPFHYFLWRSGADGEAVGINHDKNYRQMRQQREPEYVETGAVYVMRVPGFVQARHRFFGKTVLYEMPPERCLEIDEPVDFEIAELLKRKQIEQQRLASLPEKIGALVFDFDGVFTDNKAVLMQDGSEGVIVDRGDGMGVRHLREAGLPMLILSTETNPVVDARAKKLRIPCRYGVEDKWSVLKAWLTDQQIDPSQVIYVGNDVNDLAVMAQIGCAVAVADAHADVLAHADVILAKQGGAGAVRELSDLILSRLLASKVS
jgi:YrbI family 3-deoxy-D-manno-octulosonate 8-phosphate phosphatase